MKKQTTNRRMLSNIPVFQKPKTPILIHFVKCVSVPPEKSHPKNYINKDGNHLINLFKKAQNNNAKFVLVNCDVKLQKFKRIFITDITKEKLVKTGKEDQTPLTRKQIKQWTYDVKKTHVII